MKQSIVVRKKSVTNPKIQFMSFIEELASKNCPKLLVLTGKVSQLVLGST